MCQLKTNEGSGSMKEKLMVQCYRFNGSHRPNLTVCQSLAKCPADMKKELSHRLDAVPV